VGAWASVAAQEESPGRRLLDRVRGSTEGQPPAPAAEAAPAAPVQLQPVLDEPAELAPAQGALVDETTSSPGGLQRAAGESAIDLGRESDEPISIRELFNDPNFLRLLGEKPRFVYRAEDKPDPMVFPPVRNQAIFQELWAESEELKKAGRWEEALQKYHQILDMNDERFIVQTRSAIAEARRVLGVIVTPPDPTLNVELPDWVRNNARGVLFDERNPMCLVGESLLAVGDYVPGFADVTIVRIEKQTIVFSVLEREFPVEVSGVGVLPAEPGAQAGQQRRTPQLPRLRGRVR